MRPGVIEYVYIWHCVAHTQTLYQCEIPAFGIGLGLCKMEPVDDLGERYKGPISLLSL